MEGFELFDNQSINRVVDKITITKNYLINFPTAFYKINNLENKKTVLLYYNKASSQIGIEFKDGEDERGFKITGSNGGQNGGYITAKNFFAMNGLVEKIRTGRYDYSKKNKRQENLDEKTFFVIKLEYNNLNSAES